MSPSSNPLPNGQIDLTPPLIGDAYPRLSYAPLTQQVYVGSGTALPSVEVGSTSSGFYNAQSTGATGDGITDDTALLQTAITAAAGRTIYFPKGSYLVSGGLTVPAGTTLLFDNATFLINFTAPAGLFRISTSDVTVLGKYTCNFQSKATPFIVGTTGGDRFQHDAHAIATNANSTASADTFLIRFTSCSYIKIGGFITTTGNSPLLVKVDRGANIEVYGVVTPPLTESNGNFACVHVQETTGSGTMYNINIHDCFIDGGGAYDGAYGAIVVGTATTAICCYNITINNCTVLNTDGLSDGLDVVLAQYVTITNCVFLNCLDGIAVAGSVVVSVDNCVAVLCRGAAYTAGDPSVPTDTNVVTYNGCQAFGCNTTGTGSSQFLVWAPSGHTTNLVHFNDCVAFAESVSEYELTITGDGGGVTDISVTGGVWLGGSVGHVLDTIGGVNAASYRIKNVWGWNPKGNLGADTPLVPLTTVPLTNNSGFDCTVIVYTGGGITVSGIAIGGVLTGYTISASSASYPLPIPAGQTITLAYAGGTPTWSWFAD